MPAIALAIFPLCQRGAAWTNACWNNNPCFGGWEPVFKDLNNAFSAPNTWIVLAGIVARFFMLPARARIRAPTAVPKIAARFGATLSISSSIWFSSLFLISKSSRICFAKVCTNDKLTSEMSPPLLFSVTRDSISTFDSGNPASSKVFFDNLLRFPAKTICE